MSSNPCSPFSSQTRRLKAAQRIAPAVLVVDPDADLAQTTADELRHAGYEVVSCADAVEFLLQLGRRSYDVVLLEVDLPDIDGCLLVDILSQKWVDAEILLMTSLPPGSLAIHFPRCRPEEVLWKPLDREGLLSAVGRALHRTAG